MPVPTPELVLRGVPWCPGYSPDLTSSPFPWRHHKPSQTLDGTVHLVGGILPPKECPRVTCIVTRTPPWHAGMSRGRALGDSRDTKQVVWPSCTWWQISHSGYCMGSHAGKWCEWGAGGLLSHGGSSGSSPLLHVEVWGLAPPGPAAGSWRIFVHHGNKTCN